jgi:hypothetical protein
MWKLVFENSFVVLEIFDFRFWHWPLRSESAAIGVIEKLGDYPLLRAEASLSYLGLKVA